MRSQLDLVSAAMRTEFALVATISSLHYPADPTQCESNEASQSYRRKNINLRSDTDFTSVVRFLDVFSGTAAAWNRCGNASELTDSICILKRPSCQAPSWEALALFLLGRGQIFFADFNVPGLEDCGQHGDGKAGCDQPAHNPRGLLRIFRLAYMLAGEVAASQIFFA